MINGIHHVAIVVRDLDVMVPFYRDVLGFKEVAPLEWDGENVEVAKAIGVRGTSVRSMMLRSRNLMVEVFEYITPPGRRSDEPEPWNLGYTHFCLDVTDIDAEYERLVAGGMTFHSPPPPRGSIDVRSIYGRDPEGNIIEIWELFGADVYKLDALEAA